MTTTITYGTTSTTPDVVLGFATRVDKPVRLHRIIGRGDPDVTLSEPRLRTGTLECLYRAEAAAFDGFALVRELGTFALVDDERPALDMTFVVTGVDITRRGRRWALLLAYEEVTS